MRFSMPLMGLMAIFYGGYFLKIPPSIHQDIRYLSFIPALSVYSNIEIMEDVRLTKIDFLQNEVNEEYQPVIDRLLYIPQSFSGR